VVFRMGIMVDVLHLYAQNALISLDVWMKEAYSM
jgi:hypothetical protein